MSGDFPPESLEEILHRLPLKSLVRFTSVCKAWNSLITNDTFISDHLNRPIIQASNGNGCLFLQLFRWPMEFLGPRSVPDEEFYLFYSDNYHRLFVEIFPLTRVLSGFLRVVGTCNGLICMYDDRYSDTLIIWNPLIRKYVVLPKPTLNCGIHIIHYCQLLVGFGFDSRNKDYKVIRAVINSNEEYIPQVEVYSHASRSWRNITIRGPLSCARNPTIRTTAQVLVNGVVHWVVRYSCNGQIHSIILTFDVVEETFGEITLPPHLRETRSDSLLSVLEGGHYLSVLLTTYLEGWIEIFSIWVMKEYGVVESWTEVFCCGSNRYEDDIIDVLALGSNGKVMLTTCNGTLALLDPVTELVTPLTGPKYFHVHIGSYVESLVFINKEPDILSY